MKPLRIDNRTARRLWLTSQGLSTTPTGPLDLLTTIKALGFVQLDSIQTVARAHHHILWSRNNNYRQPMLNRMLARDRSIFEHFTHDASVLPMDFLPVWERQFRRKAEELDRKGWLRRSDEPTLRDRIMTRIREEGALSSHAFDTKVEGPKEMWSRPPHKRELDRMWFAGELATCHRKNFTKFYNLPERVFPKPLADLALEDDTQVDELCQRALDRLGFGSAGDIQRYWDAVSNGEARDWVASADVQQVEIASADGTWLPAIAPPDIDVRLEDLGPATSRLRIINPFDPVIRDRTRLERLFGFSYRVEMFVPAAKRVWGYYVYPILEGERFVGRIEAKADRKGSSLNVLQFWPEAGVKWPASRHEKLAAELDRLRRFVGLERVVWPG